MDPLGHTKARRGGRRGVFPKNSVEGSQQWPMPGVAQPQLRICMFVYNNCVADPRVLKEATTLIEAGHRLQVVAVLDKRTVEREQRDGIAIVRINRNPIHYRLLRRGRWTRRLLGRGPSRVRRFADRVSGRATRPVLRAVRQVRRFGRRRVRRLGSRVRRRMRPSWRRAVRVLRRAGHVPALRLPLAIAGSPFLGARSLARLVRRQALAGAARLRASWPPRRGPRDVRELMPHAPDLAAIDRRISRLVRRSLMQFHKPLLFFDYYLRAYRWAAPRRFDVVHAHDLNTLPVAWALAQRRGIPLVYDSHELYPEVSTLSPRESAIWSRIERRLIRRANAVITVCESIAEELSERYGIPRPTVLLNCPPASTVPATLTQNAPNRLRERAGLLDCHEPIVLYQGGFSPFRGLEELVEAAEHLEHGVVVLMGWGRLHDQLAGQVAQRGLEARVRIIDAAAPDEVLEFTRGADLGVIPYRPVGLNNTYTTPNKLFEYLSVGLPIAGSRLPELTRFIESLGIGATFDPRDPRDIAATIDRMLADPELLRRMRVNALAARERFVWEVQAEALLDVYSCYGAPAL